MNRKEIFAKGHTYIITRRFLDKTTGKMRVRVVAYAGLICKPENVVFDKFKDFNDMHEGDAFFIRQIRWAMSLWNV